jgi:hypothetical protein
MIVITIILLTQGPKNVKTGGKCYENTGKYITDVVVSDTTCPDNYYDASKNNNMSKYIKLNGNFTNKKLCYRIPEQICDTDTIVTDLNISSSICQNNNIYQCNNRPKVSCNTQTTTYNLPELSCRCQNCGDIPVGYFQNGSRITNCSGIINDQNNILCTSQNIYQNNISGIRNISLMNEFDNDCPHDNISNSNICFYKK